MSHMHNLGVGTVCIISTTFFIVVVVIILFILEQEKKKGKACVKTDYETEHFPIHVE